VEAVAKYTEKQMASVSAGFGLDLGTIRGAVNNACRILEVPSPALKPRASHQLVLFSAVRIYRDFSTS
jgi:hypothetical protein